MESSKEIDLSQFCCTEQYHRTNMCHQLLVTDGVLYLAEQAGAFWLIDEIAFLQPEKVIKNDPMLQEIQFWTLFVENNVGKLICERDTNDVAFEKKIPFTDFPLPEIKFYLQNNVLMLPSEY